MFTIPFFEWFMALFWAHDPICRSWYPLVNVYIKLWKITIFNRYKSTITGPFSIANCWHNQRVPSSGVGRGLRGTSHSIHRVTSLRCAACVRGEPRAGIFFGRQMQHGYVVFFFSGYVEGLCKFQIYNMQSHMVREVFLSHDVPSH